MAEDLTTYPLDTAPSGADLTTTPVSVAEATPGDISASDGSTTVTSNTDTGGDATAAAASAGDVKTAEQQQQDNADKTGDNASTDPNGNQPVELEEVTVTASSFQDNPTDTRVRIIVPDSYRTIYTTAGKLLEDLGGIIFPYTPSINYSYKAEYRDQSVIHSNFRMNFYQRSYVSDIQIQGKFTVQNDNDANAYLATHHLLRALTKMQWAGGTGNFKDDMPGAPPPVCILKGYGSFMFHNTPVVITDFKVDLPSDVDYYKLWNTTTNKIYLNNTAQMIPVISTITITCMPMYSRAEMQDFSVAKMKFEKGRLAGYL